METKCSEKNEAKCHDIQSGLQASGSMNWWLVFGVLLLLTGWTRLHKVAEPDHVCWDETHFGKMGSWYINRTFFFDVHPPLGKMLIALSGYLTGYDGTFPFEKPGDKYEGVQYVGMRVFCAILGASIVPFAFITVWEMTHSLTAAVFSAAFILCDVGILTLTRYILLDPILLFFVMGSVLAMTKFNSCGDRPFSWQWWTWLVLTGAMLACAVSVKFVGLFVIILVGIRTLAELWCILGDLSRPLVYVIHHFIARILCLVILPILLYMFFFFIHLQVLSKSGNGDGFYSSAFQSKLEGNSLYNATMPREVANGAVVTLKNHRTGGGYLHSHWHLYPEGVGARQQQVTTYTHKDDNNLFLVKKHSSEPAEEDQEVELLRHGDLLRLEHVTTRRNLHSHKEPAPLSRKHYQVTGYGENGTGDANDVWKVLIVGGKDGDVVTTVTSKLKLVHYLQHCVLTSSGKQLPKWGYEQQEVTCNPNMRDKNALWNVEDNFFSKLPNVSFEVYAPGFLERFIESHAVMFQGNAGLKPKEGEVTSRPWQWPINFRGQFFSGNSYRIYLLGNPVIWWGNLVFLLLYLGVQLCHAVRRRRGKPVHESTDRMSSACGWLFLGWALHYVPFWAMGRVLYFHHYFPALLFSSMLTGVVLSYTLESLPQLLPAGLAHTVYHWLLGVFSSIIFYSFYLFSPLAYGMSGPSSSDPESSMYGLRWMESWEF